MISYIILGIYLLGVFHAIAMLNGRHRLKQQRWYVKIGVALCWPLIFLMAFIEVAVTE